MPADDNPNPIVVPKPKSWKRRLLRFVFVFVILPYVGLFLLMTTVQRSLIYRPTKTRPLLAKSVIKEHLDVDDVEIKTDDDLTLHGWRFHAHRNSPADLEVADPGFTVIYFSGNGGCRADRVTDCRDLTPLGCDVILFDYRGYGDNKGSPREDLLAADARRVWQFVTKDFQVPPERIVLFGESMGGAVATRLASEQSIAGTPPAALILNSTFASLAETVTWHYPMFPFQYVLLDRFPSVERIPHVTCPVLQFHGTADDIVAFDQGRRLFDAAPAKSASGIEKEFVRIPGGQHNFITMSDMGSTLKPLLDKIRKSKVAATRP